MCQPLPRAWGGSLSPYDRLSDLRDAPSHSSPFEFAKEKRKTKITRLASSGQKPDTSGLSLSENRCGAESLVKVTDGVWALGTSPCISTARAPNRSMAETSLGTPVTASLDLESESRQGKGF